MNIDSETLMLIITLAIALELMVAGIIGLIKKRINAKSLAMSLILLPLKLFSLLYGFIDEGEYERGKAAISASVSTIVLSILISYVSITFFLMTKEHIAGDAMHKMIPIVLTISLVIMITTIIYLEIKKIQL